LTNSFSNRKIPLLKPPFIKSNEQLHLDFVTIIAGFFSFEDAINTMLATTGIKREVGPNGDGRSKGH
jgi:hypothetical protein